MSTEVLHVDACWPDPGALRRAVNVLRGGGLVAFPTETVYGLGANALDATAVIKIFAAKGRPPINPIIVHIAGIDAALELVKTWPNSAQLLAERFWPGPLTIVLPRSKRVPDEVTAGGSSVALRVPSHPVALGLLEFCDFPLAAPSANRSSGLSPTRGDHVLRSLEGRFDLLLDAGATPGGLESTVIDLTSSPPRLLRPGLVSAAEIEAVLGTAVRLPQAAPPVAQPLPSPGLLARHYAPRTPLEVAPGDGSDRVRQLCDMGKRVGWLTLAPAPVVPGNQLAEFARIQPASNDCKLNSGEFSYASMPVLRVLPNDPTGYAAQLYAVLHELDEEKLDRIIVAEPPDTAPWLAIRDRLRRAGVQPGG